MKLDDHYSEGLNELMDLGSEYQWLPTPQKKKKRQSGCVPPDERIQHYL